jgi:nitrate/nitrite transporter NarK
VGDALRERRTWLLAAIYFAMPVANYGVGFFLPLMVKAASGASNLVVGGLTAIPYAVAAVAMIASGRHSDRTGERRWHIVAAAVVCAAGLILTTRATGVIGTVASLSLAMAGVMSMFGPFWAVATSPMRGVGAAASIALINSIGNTGGFVGPFLLGAIDEATHSFSAGLFAIAGLVIAMAVAVVVVLRNVTRQG